MPTPPSLPPLRRIRPVHIAAAVGAVVLLSIVSSGVYTIDEGERGVVLRTGSVVGVAEPGLHLKLPAVDRVQRISVQTRVVRFTDVASYSRDQQPANLTVSMNYQVLPERVGAVYAQYGNIDNLENRLIDPRILEVVKTVFGRYDAVTAVQERGKLNLDITEELRRAMDPQLLQISGFQLENIDYSDEYERSIEQRMQASVEVERLRQNAEREKVQAQITLTQANAKAEAVRAQGQAEADATRMRGEAEAAAIDAKGKALRENPQLVRLISAERWDGRLPQSMIPGGALPFVELSAPAPAPAPAGGDAADTP